jgi:ATP-dependent Clp protease ATP-binding subunit ClpA
MRLNIDNKCSPDGWVKELKYYINPEIPLLSHVLIIYGNIYDLIFIDNKNGVLCLPYYLIRIFYEFDNIYTFDVFNKVKKIKGKDIFRNKNQNQDPISRLRERGMELNESRGSNIQMFITLDRYMKDHSKSNLIIIKDFDALVSENRTLNEEKEITIAIKEWGINEDVENSKNLAILLVPDLCFMPEILKSLFTNIRVPFPCRDDYIPFLKNIYHELLVKYNKSIEFNCPPLEIIEQFDKYSLSFRDVKSIMSKAYNENIILDKNSIKKLIMGNNVTRGFEDLTKEEVLSLYDRLNEMVIGQEDAVASVCRAIKICFTGNRDKNKPIAILLFLGPTGVGKSYLAESLAEVCFGNKNCMIIYDMSEYSEKHNAADFVGAPPGYIGYDQGSNLINKVNKIKEGIIQLDEFEKADRDVLNIFLQVFDQGRLTDKRNGKTVSFNNFIFILTSNVGQKESMNVNDPEIKKAITFSCLKKSFSPELLNRITEVVYFSPLTEESCLKIAKNELMKSTDRKRVEKGIDINFDENVVEFITKKGFDPCYNARPLKRVIEKYFEEPFSDLLLEGEIKKGDVLKFEISEDNEAILEKIN